MADEAGKARSVTATREPSDPNRDLWWAHTGGGAATSASSPDTGSGYPATGADPARLLPQAPTSVLTFQAQWNWRDIDRVTFARLVRNYGDWTERNSDASSPFARLYSTLVLNRRQHGTLELSGLTTAGTPPDVHALAITARGHGHSSKPRDGYRLGDMSEDLRVFMDALELPTAVIVGHSMGSMVAQRFAIDHPGRVAGLVLMGSFQTLHRHAVIQEFWDTELSHWLTRLRPGSPETSR